MKLNYNKSNICIKDITFKPFALIAFIFFALATLSVAHAESSATGAESFYCNNNSTECAIQKNINQLKGFQIWESTPFANHVDEVLGDVLYCFPKANCI